MPRSVDSSSSEGGFVFETTEFEVHMVNTEETLFSPHAVTNERCENELSNSIEMEVETLNLDQNELKQHSYNSDIIGDSLQYTDDIIIGDHVPNISNIDGSINHKICNNTKKDVNHKDSIESIPESTHISNTDEGINQKVSDNVEDASHDDCIESVLENSFIENESENDSINENIEHNAGAGISLQSDLNDSEEKSTDKLPFGRVKTVMKLDPEVHSVSADGIFTMARAAELFLQWFGEELYETISKQNKSTVDKHDIDLTIASNPVCRFLEGAYDWKISDD